MSHNHNCEVSRALITLIINHNSSHNRAWINDTEIIEIYKHHQPCAECQIHPEQLSIVTGRLYKPTWDEHLSNIDKHTQKEKIVDIFPQS